MSWLTTWANLQVAVLLAALAAFTTMRYTHAPRSAFPVVLSGVNLATAVATLLLTVAEAVEPTVCAFFMHEALFAVGRDAFATAGQPYVADDWGPPAQRL